MNIFKTPEGYIYSNRALLALFIPLLIEYGLEFFVGLADSIMVASLGEAAISGVSLVDFLVQLLIFSFQPLQQVVLLLQANTWGIIRLKEHRIPQHSLSGFQQYSQQS